MKHSGLLGQFDSKSVRFSRFGVERREQHDRDGHGRGPTAPSSQRQHGRLWELGGKPGFDRLTHTPAPSSSPEGKSAGNPKCGFLKPFPPPPNRNPSFPMLACLRWAGPHLILTKEVKARRSLSTGPWLCGTQPALETLLRDPARSSPGSQGFLFSGGHGPRSACTLSPLKTNINPMDSFFLSSYGYFSWGVLQVYYLLL